MFCRLVFFAVLLLLPLSARAEVATVAVASNFITTLEKLGERFEEESGHTIRIVSGSTGKLYTQIMHGAPFDLFLAADAERPALLTSEGQASAPITYATGRLVLWSRKGSDPAEDLGSAAIERLAIANPDLAPYGRAAMEALTELGRTGANAPALVMGENVAQAIAMLATGNVDHGVIPLSIRTNAAMMKAGTIQRIPAPLHQPIRQDAVLLNQGQKNPAAVAFFAFLTSEAAQDIIIADGYDDGKSAP